MERKTVPKPIIKVPINRRKLKEAEKARRVTFYRNGDYFDAGVKVALRGSRPFPTMPHLLDYLSQKSRMPAKKLFAAADGRPIKSLEQLEDGAFYVISSDGKFEPLPYGSVPPPKTSHIADALPVRQEDLQLFRPASQNLGKKKKKKKKEIEQLIDQPIGRREGRLLTIAAREGGARATLLFNDRNPPPFEDVLRDFGRALGLGHVHMMSTPSGRQVRSISQLKNEFQDVDTFFLDETSDDLTIADEKRLLYSPNRWKPPESKSAVSTRRSEIPVRKTEIRASKLHLDWIHGYSGGDLIVLDNGELVYAVGAAVVLYRRTDDSQRHYLDHTEDVCSLCVHPSGRMMASGQISSTYRGATVNIWLVQSLQTIASVVRLAGNPISIAFSSHDFVLLSIEAGQEEDCLTFWDWESDALLARVEMRKERLTGGAFHPREPDLAVTFGEHHLAFWRKRQDGLLARIDALSPGHSGRTILSWAFIGESSLAVGDSSGYLTLWALLPGDAFRILKEVRAHQSEVRSLLAMREGTLVSGGDDQIKAWDSRQKLLHLETTGLPEGEVKALCLQGPTDAALYVGTADTILDGSVQSSFRILIQGLESDCLDLAVDSEGMNFVSVDRSHCVCRWTVRNLLWKTRPQVDCCCVGYHPEGLAIIVGGSNGKLLVLHAEGGLVVATISVADAALKTLAYDADATSLAIGCEDGNIYICESKNHGYLYKMHTVLKNEWPILQIDWSSDSDCILTAYRKDDFCEVALWRIADSKRLKSALAQTMDWPQHTCTLSHNILGIWKRIKDVFYLSCNRRGSKLAAGSQDGYIRIFKYPYKESDQNEYEEQKQSTQPIAAVRFLNMDHLISASGSAVFIWNLKK